MSLLDKLHIDSFLLSLLAAVGVATIAPCEGATKTLFDALTTAAIALLFFMHGAKLSREAIMQGIGHWRLHLCIFFSTFVIFPLVGLCLNILPASFLPPELYSGFLYLCALPATVQSSIAFTSIAGGNVAAAVCSASASSILGVFLSPLLVGLLMAAQDGSPDMLHAVFSIMLQLLLPFTLGHLARPHIGAWVDKHKKIIGKTDRTSILLVVYTAFSEAVVQGLWSQLTVWSLLSVCVASLIILAIMIGITTYGARFFGFSKPDEIAIIFCGSKKSLATGVPMAKVLFPAASVGMMVLPLMIFHQIQLMVCATLATRYARQAAQKTLGEGTVT